MVKFVYRTAGAAAAWAMACAIAVFVDVAIGREQHATAALVVQLLLPLITGAIVGTAFWRVLERRPLVGGIALAALVLLTGVVALIASSWSRS